MLMDKNNPHGGDIYGRKIALDFSANVNPFGTPQAVRQAVFDAAQGVSAYPDAYCRALRRALSAHEGVPYEMIICGNGAADLIYSFAYAVRRERPACSVLIPQPTFSEYETAACAAGLAVRSYLLREERGFAPDEEILSQINEETGAVFLCTPNNPTGILCSPATIRGLAETCRAVGARLFLDCCFLDLSDEPDSYEIPRFVRDFPNVFVLRAFTKSYGMAGLRLGYGLCADGGFLDEMSACAPCWNVSGIAQAAGIAALSCGEELLRFRALIAEERPYLAGALSALGFEVFPGTANFLFFRAPGTLADALAAVGILIRSCENYRGLGAGYYRIAVRTHEENVRLIAAAKTFMNRHGRSV